MLRELDQEDDEKTGSGIVWKKMLMNAKLQIGKRDQKTLLTGYRHFGTTYQSHLQEDLIYTTAEA